VATRTIESRNGFLLVGEAQRCPLKFSCWYARVLAMTLQTPAHGQRSNLLYPLHGLHGSVASLASNAGKHMLAMIEINKIR